MISIESTSQNNFQYESLKWQQNPYEIMNCYFRWLKRRNPKKYWPYIFGMRYLLPFIFRHPSTVSGSHKILPLIYAACRILDDVTDGDFSDMTWPGFDRWSYVMECQQSLDAYIRDWALDSKSPETILFKEAIELSNRTPNSDQIIAWIKIIIDSLLFDAQRIQNFHNSWDIKPETEENLEEHFTSLDVEWTGLILRALLNIKWPEVEALMTKVGIACRREYTLSDLPDDLWSGIVNISVEDMRKYWITISDLQKVRDAKIVRPIDPKKPSIIFYQNHDEYPKSVILWIKDQLMSYRQGMLSVSNFEMSKLSLPWRILLHTAYRHPSNKRIWKLEKIFMRK